MHPLIWLIPFAYLLGSVPFGLILGKAVAHVDVREHGSGNIGATNVLRTLGIKLAAPVFVLDAFKAAIPVLIARAVLPGDPAAALATGVAAVVGHNWSVFLNFRGGKGMASTLGVLLSAMPDVTLGFAVIWVSVVLITRYISLGSVIAALSVPVLTLLMGKPREVYPFALILAAMAIWRHKTNLKRLIEGTEYKLGERARKIKQ